jgi:hypothetical protein
MCSGVIPHLSGVFGLVPASSSLSTCGMAVFGLITSGHIASDQRFSAQFGASGQVSASGSHRLAEIFQDLSFLGDLLSGAFRHFFCSRRKISL